MVKDSGIQVRIKGKGLSVFSLDLLNRKNYFTAPSALISLPCAARLILLNTIAKEEVYMQVEWRKYIVSTPDILQGKPRINGTRIPVSLILGYFASGNTPEKIIHEYPDLTNEQISACLDYARDLSEFKVAV